MKQTLTIIAAHTATRTGKFRKQISIDTSVTGADTKSTVSNAPVLVRLHSGNFPYFSDARPDGADLRFISGDVSRRVGKFSTRY